MDSMQGSPSKFSDGQKKSLEQLYKRLFDQSSVDPDTGRPTRLTEEGKRLSAEARVRAEDLIPRTFDEFKTASDYEEVAQVRHQHHVLKRLRKLWAVESVIAQQAKKRQLDKERAELEYQRKLEQENNQNAQTDSQAQLHKRPSTTNGAMPRAFNGSAYAAKVNEIADGRSPKKVANDKIAFYSIKKRELGSDLALYNRSFNRRNSTSKKGSTLATTPGAFFHQRHHRNLSQTATVAFQSGAPPGALFNATQQQPFGHNKAFTNYLSVRERAVNNAREKVESLNKMALTKLKKEKMAMKAMKDQKLDLVDKFDKAKEKLATKKRFKELRNREMTQDAMQSYKDHQQDVNELLNKKQRMAAESSKRDYDRARQELGGHDGHRSHLGASQADAKSQMSKTANSAMWGRNKSQPGFLDDEEYVSMKLQSYEEKMAKHTENLDAYKTQVSQAMRDKFSRVPNIESLRADQEEARRDKWQTFLLRQRDQQKKFNKMQKEAREEREDKAEKRQEKVSGVQNNIRGLKMDYKQKCQDIEESHKEIDQKVKKAHDRRQIHSMRQRELDNLRFDDLGEQLGMLTNERFEKNCRIDEKHIALSLMNTDKRSYMMNYNDKYRAVLAKNNHDYRQEGQVGSRGYYTDVQKAHLQQVAYAPDMVKLTPAQIAKLLKEKKTEE